MTPARRVAGVLVTTEGSTTIDELSSQVGVVTTADKTWPGCFRLLPDVDKLRAHRSTFHHDDSNVWEGSHVVTWPSVAEKERSQLEGDAAMDNGAQDDALYDLEATTAHLSKRQVDAMERPSGESLTKRSRSA